MNPFLSDRPLFDFTYGGKKMQDCDYTVSRTEKGDTATMIYRFPNGLQITNIVTKYDDFGAYEWVNWLENTSDSPTDLITDLWDCSYTLPMEHEDEWELSPYMPGPGTSTHIMAPMGEQAQRTSFVLDNGQTHTSSHDYFIKPGEVREFRCSGGRSSDSQNPRRDKPEGHAPFFHVHKGGRGFIAAIGWTGQWLCNITRSEDDATFRSKIEDTAFYLLAGEKFRTSSVVLMPYEGLSVVDAHNRWRRLVKKHFSLIGSEGRDAYGPLCMQLWGGQTSDKSIKAIQRAKEYQMPFDYAWVDAGWYGTSSLPSSDDFDGPEGWSGYVGDWRVNPYRHPNGLKVLSDAAADAGMKFLLWFEPERAICSTPIVSEHPEYFIWPPQADNRVLLLDLGNPEAWQYVYDILSRHIEELNISCYRQDFNMQPLDDFWRPNDKGGRRGITEIKHINGLYRLWDALLERFPHLLIDNCSSGGRRIDIETLRRSIPLWRSDFACAANYDPAGLQMHQLTFNTWFPYSGTCTGRFVDTYRVRSGYTAATSTTALLNDKTPLTDDDMKRLKKHCEEYLLVRPYFSEDFYPLTDPSPLADVWSAAQFDSPEMQSGLIQVFRRENSPYPTAVFQLGGIREDCVYRFRDIDTDEEFTLTGAELKKDGLSLTIPEQRAAKLYLYSYGN